ncbi:MAG: hypothetical protein AAF988_02750 [Pseudomonadota bacterium]
MSEKEQLNLAEKRELGASFFIATNALDILVRDEYMRLFSDYQEKTAREFADKYVAKTKLGDSDFDTFAGAVETHILGLLRRLKDIPKQEKNRKIVAEKLVEAAKYYVVSTMFDVAESKDILTRDDMRDTAYGNAMPPKPQFPKLPTA